MPLLIAFLTPAMLTCQADLATEPDQPTPSATTDGETEPYFHYFAYGSCMCPVDLKPVFGRKHSRLCGWPRHFKGLSAGVFRYYSAKRQCGALDVLPDPSSEVHGVLYRLPWRLSHHLESAGRRSSRRLPPRIRCRETGWTVLRRGQNLRRGCKRHRWRLPPTTGISMWCYEEQLPASCQSLTAGSFF